MVIAGLDISTKTGYSIIHDGNLVDYGVIKTPAISDYLIQDFNMLLKAKDISGQIYKIISKHLPDLIFVEQTNSGKFRSSQKQLEFIHFAFLDSCINELGVTDKIKYLDTSQWRKIVNVKLSKEQKKHNKLVKNRFARGKITSKHLSVKWVNENFNLNLKLKDNDIADAICISYAGYLTWLNKPIAKDLNSALSL